MAEDTPSNQSENRPSASSSSRKNWIFNGVIIFLGLLTIYFLVSAFIRIFNSPPDPSELSASKVDHKLVIQIEVLNGNGIPKVTDQLISYLRSQGFDVVEKGNYNSFNVENSSIIDRVGDLSAARKLAETLNIDDSKIVTQISYEYYADLTLVLGKDYKNLSAFRK